MGTEDQLAAKHYKYCDEEQSWIKKKSWKSWVFCRWLWGGMRTCFRLFEHIWPLPQVVRRRYC